jgi:limonene-1,2-epoxide hydrolase
MNDADLATCRRFSDALAREDLAAAAADAHADIELRLPCGTRHGTAALATLLTSAEDVERTIVIADVLDATDRAIALARLELRHSDTREIVGLEQIGAVLEVLDGRVVSWQPFHHHHEP